jgi:prepilin-type processing-associated H-X9-DG protein
MLADLKGRHNEEDQDIFEEEARQDTPQLKDFKCPYDKRTVENGGLHVEMGHIVQGSSYAMNMMSLRPHGPWRPNIVYALKTDQVVKPAEKIHFMDGQWFVVYIGGAEYKRVWDVYGDKMGGWEWDAASYRHDEGANIAFYDGHVEYWPKEQICPYIPGDARAEWEAREAIWLPIPDQVYLP